MFFAERKWFVGHAHNWSAIPMFVLIIAVAVFNAFSFKRKQRDPNARNRYLLLAFVMPVTVGGLWLTVGFGYHLIKQP